MDMITALMENQTIIEESVAYAQISVNQLNGEEPFVIVNYQDKSIKIYESELIIPPYSKHITSLEGSIIPFIITEYDKESNIYLGSNKQAVEMTSKDTMGQIESGKTVKGRIFHIVPHGVYVSLKGIYCLIRDIDFSDCGILIKDLYDIGDYIEAVFLKTSPRGTILLRPKDKVSGATASFSILERRQICQGKVVKVFPQYIYVNVAPKTDALCSYPEGVSNLQEGDMVNIRITVVDDREHKLRGKVVNVIK